jgi:hypothetical protein
MKAELIDASGDVSRSYEAAVRTKGGQSLENVQFTLGLGKLAAGEYRIRVTASEGDSKDVKEVGIIVREPS